MSHGSWLPGACSGPCWWYGSTSLSSSLRVSMTGPWCFPNVFVCFFFFWPLGLVLKIYSWIEGGILVRLTQSSFPGQLLSQSFLNLPGISALFRSESLWDCTATHPSWKRHFPFQFLACTSPELTDSPKQGPDCFHSSLLFLVKILWCTAETHARPTIKAFYLARSYPRLWKKA